MQRILNGLFLGLLLVFGVAGSAAAAPAPLPAASTLPSFMVQVNDPSCSGGIGDFVWFDENGNGLRDAAESSKGINGVVLELRDSSGTLLMTVTTGAAVGSIPGSYLFPLVCPGTYTVTIVSGVPPGYVPTISPPGADPARDSSTSPATVTIVRVNGQDTKNATVDFGFVAACTGSIGDRVWNDVNSNGVQDAGELGMSGVPVQLSANGSVVATTTTDANGNYLFSGLCPGSYIVTVTTPADMVSSPPFGTADVSADSDVSGVVVPLGANENNPTIDFGFYAVCASVIGDRVWFDANRNGIQDAGELGIANVTVELLNSGGTVIATTITDASGNYLFTGLCAGTYTVRVDNGTLPAGYSATVSFAGAADVDSNGSPATVVLGGNTDLTIDFGYVAPCVGVIGDFVWFDTNGNGIQDAGEAGIANVRVVLRDAATDAIIAVDMTDAAGGYLFEGLCAGNYVVEVDPTTLPPGLVASPANHGANDAVDSDGVNHEAPVSLAADNSTNLTIDFGYFKKTLIQLVKLTNGTDNNSPTGPVVNVGSTVTWTYQVTNTGSTEPLANVVVSDDNGTPGNPADDFAPTFSGGDTDGDGLLDVGEVWIYTASGIATAGQYRNVATASGTGAASGTPTNQVTDPDHYFGALPSIALVKLTNGTDNNSPTGPIVSIGSTVTWTYRVTNTSNVPLSNVRIVDDNGTAANTADDFTVCTIATLAAGASQTCTASRPAIEGQYRNWATATGTYNGTTVTAKDPDHYFGRNEWKGETAVGAGTRYPGTNNWFMYTAYTTNKVDLIAGQHYDAGDIYMSRSGSGASARTTIRITLHSGFRWAPGVGGVLKIQPFNSAPTTYLPPGQFAYHFTAPSTTNNSNTTVVFSGNTVTVTLPGHAPRFYGIHGDVQRQLP